MPVKKWVVVGVGVATGLVVGNMIFWDVKYQTECVKKFRDAQKYCFNVNKPLLNIGCGSNPEFVGDVNLDIQHSILPNFIQHDLMKPLPFNDKSFGACVAFHTLEHMDDPKFVLSEMNRVADRTYVAVPSYADLLSWLYLGHKWMFVRGPNPIRINPSVNIVMLASIGIGLFLIYRGSKR